jgi:SHS family lactate transporter-like MFS transporter
LFLADDCFVGGQGCLSPGWLAERFLTAVRATAAGFVYHQGAVWGAAVAPLLTYFAANQQMGLAKPMIYGTVASSIVYLIAECVGPETKGKVLTATLEVIAPAV